jgi:hypothetical protein
MLLGLRRSCQFPHGVVELLDLVAWLSILLHGGTFDGFGSFLAAFVLSSHSEVVL